MIIQVPGFRIDSVELRDVRGKALYDVTALAMGLRIRLGVWKAEVASKCVIGAECVLCFRLKGGKFDSPELQLVDVLPCK